MTESANFNPGVDGTGETFSPDQLIAGDKPTRTKGIQVKTGQGVMKRGTVIGIITASGLAVKSLEASEDGSEAVNCILGEDIDATSGAVDTFAYIAGDFNQSQMTFGTGHTAALTREAFRELSIYLIDPVVGS